MVFKGPKNLLQQELVKNYKVFPASSHATSGQKPLTEMMPMLSGPQMTALLFMLVFQVKSGYMPTI